MGTSSQVVEARAESLAAARASDAPGPLELWHLLSLDAPTVAALWTWFVARTVHVELPPAVPVAMFLAVWLLYAADRLMDTMRGPEDLEELEARHRFHRDHRHAFKVAMGAAVIVLVPLMVAIPAALLHLYAALGVLLVAWFALIHLLPGPSLCRLPKELIPGPFFAVAVFIPCLGQLTFRLALAALFLALLCVLNCLSIFAWEHTGESVAAHPATRTGVRILTPLALACIAGPPALLPFASELAPIWIAIAGSAALLLRLDRAGARLDRTTLRATADLVLLTPLAIAPFLR